MAMTNAEDLFYTLLSDVYAREQFQAQFWDQLSQQVQDPEIKDIVTVRGFFAKENAMNIEKAFQMLGHQPSPTNVQAYKTMLEDWRKELDQFQRPGMRALYVLAKIRHIQNWRIGEYMTLSLMAEASGHRAVASLLEHNLADTVDFVERSRERFREMVCQAIGGRAAGRAA
jgi:ferritin-like metal-binding protein YciE